MAFARDYKTENPWEQVKELDGARKLYRRALDVPMQDLDTIWRDYEKFEKDWNKLTADTALMKAKERYLTSKKCLRERKLLWDKVEVRMLARPPTTVQNKQSAEVTVGQLLAWRNLIECVKTHPPPSFAAFHRFTSAATVPAEFGPCRRAACRYEKTNPQKLEDDALLDRVVYTYRCCLVSFRHYPEVWYEAALVCIDAKQVPMARAMLKQGLEALPKSLLLTFAYADFEEEQQKLEDAVQAFESLLEQCSASGKPDPLIYVQYIRFARRALGPKPARKVFNNARKAEADTHHVYLVMAGIEHITNKSPPTAAKIFQAGLQKHGEEPDFIKAYVDFLFQVSDDGNLRLLFEKILKVGPAAAGASAPVLGQGKKEVWNKFMDFEYTFAKDVTSIQSIEARRSTAFHLDPHRSRVASLLYRYHFEELWPCSPVEVRTILTNANMQGHVQAEMLAKETAELERAAALVKAAEERAKSLPRPDLTKMKLYQPPGGRLPGTGVGLPTWPPPTDPAKLKVPPAPPISSRRLPSTATAPEQWPFHGRGLILARGVVVCVSAVATGAAVVRAAATRRAPAAAFQGSPDRRRPLPARQHPQNGYGASAAAATALKFAAVVLCLLAARRRPAALARACCASPVPTRLCFSAAG